MTHTEMKKDVFVTDNKAQYDEYAKKLLSNKIVLAHILVRTVDEFKGMNPEEVVSFIEGDPYIGNVPVDPGMTNTVAALKGKSAAKIVGLNTENSEIVEGINRFDIIFYVRMKDGLSQIIINIEAQKDKPYAYYILNRAIYYVSRMISSQKEREFVGQNYNDIKQVYSIWICMNMDYCILNHIHLTDDKLLGDYNWEGSLDLLNIVMIGLPKETPDKEENYQIHRLLTTLLSKNISVNNKFEILEKEYHIPMEENMGKEILEMCNLSEGIYEEGIEKGVEKGKRELIQNMKNEGFSTEMIAKVARMSIGEIDMILQENENKNEN